MTTGDFRKTAPDISDFGLLSLSSPSVSTLDGGVRLVVLDAPDFPEVCRIVVVEGGGAIEAAEPNLAQLSVSQLREGTSRHDSRAIADIFDSSGSWLVESSMNHSRALTLHTLNSQLSTTLPLALELLASPTYPAEIVDTNLRRVSANLEVALTRNEFIANRELKRLIFGDGHPAATFATPESILDYSRSDLSDFNDKWLSSRATTIYVSGRITPAVLETIQEAVAHFAAKVTHEALPLRFVEPMPHDETGGVSRLSGAQRNQASVQIAIPVIPSTDPEMPMLSILVTALGGYFGSRLMANIREKKGLTYGISASLNREVDGNYVKISTECDASKVDIVVDEINREIESLASHPFDAVELTRLARIVRSSKASILENVFARLNYIMNCDLRAIDVAEFVGQQRLLATLTSDKLADLAVRKLINNPRYVAIVGKE